MSIYIYTHMYAFASIYTYIDTRMHSRFGVGILCSYFATAPYTEVAPILENLVDSALPSSHGFFEVCVFLLVIMVLPMRACRQSLNMVPVNAFGPCPSWWVRNEN